MKLLYCPKCNDIFKLSFVNKCCECEQSSGHYTDDLNAVYSGLGIPLGIANSSLIKAIKNQPKRGLGERFEAFIIPKECPTFKKI